MSGLRALMLASVLLSSLSPQLASAHEFWLQPGEFWWQPTQVIPLRLLTGHGTESERSRIPTRRIIRLEAIGPRAEVLDLHGRLQRGADADAELRFDAPGTYVIVLATDNQARSDLPADRFNKYLREEGLTSALTARKQAGLTHTEGTERYSRQSKSLVQVGHTRDQSRATKPVGLRLEIVPDLSPYAEPRSSTLPVTVNFEGAVLPGALVKLTQLGYGSQAVASQVTDANGRAVFEMPSQGYWLLHVTWTKPLPSTDEADFDTVFASLTFGFPR